MGKSVLLKDVELVSTGIFLPGAPVPYDKVEDTIGYLDKVSPRMKKMIEKLRPRIKELIGIEQCYFAVDPKTNKNTETNTTMSVKAIKSALDKAKMNASEIDLIVMADPVPDNLTPPTTTLIQEKLGIERCSEFEIHSNCTGVTKSMQIAFDALSLGRCKTACVIYSQLSSAYLISSHYNQDKIKTENLLLRWFLSDSASAVILKAHDNLQGGMKMLGVYNESVGGKMNKAMWAPIGIEDFNPKVLYENGSHHLGQDYGAVNELAPGLISKGINNTIKHCGLNITDVNHVLSTIPSVMVFEKTKNYVNENLGISKDIWFSNVTKKGYSGGSSVIIGFDEMLDKGMVKKGETLLVNTIESSKWMIGGFLVKSI